MKPMPEHYVTVKPTLARRIVKLVLTTLITVALSVFFAIMLVEWMAGCGETYIAADGKRYANECLFIK